MRRISREQRLVLTVVVALALAMLAFVASRIITEMVSRRIAREAASIGQNALIAIEALVAARTNLHKLTLSINALRTTQGSPGVVEELGSQLAAS
jgi:hypothetical protein